jgi:thioredoxin reductase (NADPH)
VNETAHLANKRIVILGGGDSAFDWALALGENAASCLLIHRSDGSAPTRTRSPK